MIQKESKPILLFCFPSKSEVVVVFNASVEGSEGVTLMISDVFFPGLLLEWGFPVVGEVGQLDLTTRNLSYLTSSHKSYRENCYFYICLA